MSNLIKVILADDAKFVRNLIKRYLDFSKFEIVGEADNGKELITLSEKTSPDLIITDITMSELDGVEAMKIIKKKQSDIKFLICSARADMLEEAMSLGADVFLQKPFDEKTFLEKINKII